MLPIIPAASLPPGSATVFEGIDVSIFQGDIDFSAVSASGRKAVYIRAGEGGDYTDPNYESNFNGAVSAGLYAGFYYYVTATTADAAIAQAAAFEALIRGKSYTMRPAMDYESFGGIGAAAANTVALAFLEELARLTGITPAIYTDSNNAANLWNSSLGSYPLWVADYSSGENPPDTPVWSVWAGYQYSDSGRVDGIGTAVDLDRFTSLLLTASDSAGNPLPDDVLYYTVKRGDTLYAISRRYGVTIQAIAALNGIANPNLIYAGEVLKIPARGTQPQPGNVTNYTVRRGDTLYAISRRFGVTIQAIAALNGIANPNLIYAGEVLKIPAPGTQPQPGNASYYTVRRGDTLYAISRLFGVTIQAIADANGITNPDLIYTGQVLYIP